MCRSTIISEDQQFILGFIAELRKYECLWKINPQAYKVSPTTVFEKYRKYCELDRKYYDPLWKIEHHRCKKATVAEAYENLRKFCEKWNQTATLQYVRDTINHLRSTFNREFVMELHSLAKGAKQIYKSNVYYYKAMFFTIVLNAPPGFKWRGEEVYNVEQDTERESDLSFEEDEDHISDNRDSSDESVLDLHDTEPLTIASNKQLMNVTNVHKPSFDTHREHKKIAQNKKNTDDLLREREMDEIDNISDNEDQIIDDCDVMDDSVQHLSSPESPDEEITDYAVSFNTQKRERIVSEQTADVRTANRTLNTRKRKKLNKNKDYTRDLMRVACSKLMKENDEFYGIGNNVAAKLRVVNASQRIIAEKLISDILYHAQMNTLTPNTLLSY